MCSASEGCGIGEGLLGMPDTISLDEVLWTVLWGASTIFGLRNRAAARANLEFCRSSERYRHLIATFRQDFATARARILISVASVATGVIAACLPDGSTGVGTTVVEILLFLLPLFFIWRSLGEEAARRRTLADYERHLRRSTDASSDS